MKSCHDFLKNISVNTHSSVRIEAEGKVLYIDPFGLTAAPRDADVIFLTHSHFDHYSPKDIAKVCKPETAFVLPESIAHETAPTTNGHTVLPVTPHMQAEIRGLSFETVPAYNPHKPFHPRANNWVGYVLKPEGLRIYIAGDTDATEEAAAVQCDVAMLPIGGKYTMDAEEAAALVNRLRPQAAIPIHYGSVAGKTQDFDRFAAGVDRSVSVLRLV